MATTLPLVGTAGGSTGTPGVTVTPALHASAAQDDDVFCHIMFRATDTDFDEIGDWNVIELVNGPTYTSALLHATLGATPDLELDWTTTGNTTYTYQTVTLDPLDTEGQIIDNVVLPTLGTAVLPRLINLPDPATTHILCFTGSVNALNRITTSARPDVGWLNTVNLRNPEAAGRPVLWCGDYAGPLGDTNVTLNSAVYFDPPPSHSIGHAIALALDV